jgi:YaiO family outer membrane protein
MIGSTVLIAAMAAAPPSSPDTGRVRRTHAELGYAVEAFTRDRAAWQTVRAQVAHRIGRATLVAEAAAASRFDQWDQAVSAEAYAGLPGKLSGYARVQVAPGAGVLPRTDLAAALDRGLGGGWEVGASYRRMGFRDAAIDVIGLAAARYAGPWYLQARAGLVPEAGRTGGWLALRVRRYRVAEQPDELIEAGAVVGQEVVLLGPSVAPQVRSTGSVDARVQRRLTAVWSVAAGVSWAREDGVPSRFGVNLSLRAAL